MPHESSASSAEPVAPRPIGSALATVREAQPEDRVRILVLSVVEVQACERALAAGDGAPLGPGGRGSAGVRVQRWIDLAARIVDVLAEPPVRAATRDEVANRGVAPGLHALPDDGPAWLVLSRDRPSSWTRLARAFITASHQVDSVIAPLPLVALEPIARAVEEHLAADGLLLPGRLLPLAATLLRAASPEVKRRLAGRVIMPSAPSDAALGHGICALRDAIAEAGLLTVADVDEPGPVPPAARRRAVLVPDAQAEARVTARQVRDWLADGVPYEDIAVITPASAGYQTLVRGSLADLGVPSWSTTPTQVLVSTPGGRLAAALARALDAMPGCLLCAEDVEGHDCAGSFADVSQVVHLAMPAGVRGALLASARELGLTAGLRNWRTLVSWHRGDDAALPGVTNRNADARRAQARNVEAGMAMEGQRARDLVNRLSDQPDEAGELQGAISILAEVLAPSGLPSGPELGMRLQAIQDLAASAGAGRSLFALPTLIAELNASAVSGAVTYREIVAPVLARAWGAPSRPGSGVAVLTVQQLHAAHASHVAWCGMVEGLCPPTISPDPLVAGDRATVQARRDDIDGSADRLRRGAVDLLLTAARVRIGTRTKDVASRWLLAWTGLTSVGGAALLDASSDDPARKGQAWQPVGGWRLDIVDSSIALAAAMPSLAELTTVAIPGVAAAMLGRLDDWDTDIPVPSDGVLGPYSGAAVAGSWLQSRRHPDKALSASRLRAFTDCPRRFYLSTVLGLRAHEDPDPLKPIPANALGSIAHAALQGSFDALCLASNAQRVALLRDAITSSFTGHLPFVDASDPTVASTIDQQAAAIVAVIPQEIWSRPDRPLTEQYLTGVIDGLPFEGYLDFRWDTLVADLKTGRKEPAKHASQLGVYAELMHQETHSLVETRMWFAKAGSPGSCGVAAGPTVPATDPDDPALAPQLRDVRALHAALDDGLFPAVGSPLDPHSKVCGFCDFTQICDPASGERWKRIAGDPVFAPLAGIGGQWGTG